jgi:signal transduction histidine kinase
MTTPTDAISTSSPGLSHETGRALVVGEDTTNRASASAQFDAAGFAPGTCTFHAATAQLRSTPSYDLVAIESVSLPERAIDLVREVRADDWLRRMPILMLTPFAGPEGIADDARDRERAEAFAISAFEAGADCLLRLHTPHNVFAALTRALLRLARLRDDGAAQRLLAERNRNLYEETRRALQARDLFLSIASHELRTPLTPLVGQLQLLQEFTRRSAETGALPPEAMRLLEGADRQLARINRLVGDLFDASTIDIRGVRLSVSDFDARAPVEAVVEQFAETARRTGCTVDCVLPPPHAVRWDRERVEQVLSNLLANAFRYGAGKPVRVQCRIDGERVEYAVSDQGPGIDPADQARIFRRFERAVPSDTRSGFGLGLYISAEFVAAHNGGISVESSPGAGATFRFWLPRFFDAANGAAEASFATCDPLARRPPSHEGVGNGKTLFL